MTENHLLQLLEAFPDKPWNWWELSENQNITLDYALSNPDKPWDWGRLSFNPNNTIDDVMSHLDKHWDCSTYQPQTFIHSFNSRYNMRIATIHQVFRPVYIL